MADQSAIIVRESNGTYPLSGPGGSFHPLTWDNLGPSDGEESRFVVPSPNNKFIAVGTSRVVHIFNSSGGSLKCSIWNRMASAKFSPLGGYLIGWDNPHKDRDNFIIWSIGEKNATAAHCQKVPKPPEAQFCGGDKLYARLSTKGEILFYNAPNFQNVVHKTPEALKVSSFSLCSAAPDPGSSGGSVPVAVFVPGTKTGEPSFARLYMYPNFDDIVASKTSFQADRVELKWNSKGKSVLFITSTNVDKTGESYYGKTMLHYLDTRGESATVACDKDTPVIQSAEWVPGSNEFCVITGKMPNTSALLLNSKCETVMEFGAVAARNSIYFNPQGNIVLLCGFGNLQGNVQVWEIKKHKRQIASCRAPNTTSLQWLNDGSHFVTATTAPRMQVDNGFKVWDLTGNVVSEWKAQKHLLDLIPCLSNPPLPFPEQKFEEILKRLENKTLKVEEKKPEAYVPIHKRKGQVGAVKPSPQAPSKSNPAAPVLSEREKKIKGLQKKLDQIEKLKVMVKEGKKLEKNQEAKLLTVDALMEEIKALEIS